MMQRGAISSDRTQGGRVLRSMVASPPDNSTNTILCVLNSGGGKDSPLTTPRQDSNSDYSSSPPNQEQYPSGKNSSDEDCTLSDETWTPSIDDEDSQDDEDEVVDSMSWQECPMKRGDFEINFDKVDQDLEHGYFEETKQIKKRILYEFNTICCDNKKPPSRLSAVEVFNAIYTTDVLLPVLAFQNKSLIS